MMIYEGGSPASPVNVDAKMEQLRATMSLARLLDGQRKRAEACAMLADIYNWFTESFDTRYLKEAEEAELRKLTVSLLWPTKNSK